MIEPVEDQPGFFRVCLGGGVYVVDSETGQCSCPSWQWRAAGKPGAACKHSRTLADYLRRERECPACEGNGFLPLRARYVDDQPIPCAECGGSGLREPEAPLTDSQLKSLFA